MYLADLTGLIAHHDVELADPEFGLHTGIIDGLISLEGTGADLDQAVAADERIYDGLEDECGLGLCVVKLGNEFLAGLHIFAGHGAACGVGHVAHDIIENILNAAALCGNTALYRDHGAVKDVGSDCLADFLYCEGIAAEIALHKLFVGLCHSLHQSLVVLLKVILAVRGNITGSGLLAVPLVALLLDHADTAGGLVAFVDREVERNDLGSVQLGQSFDGAAIVGVVQVHVGDIDHSGQIIFVAEIPCALGTYFDAGLAGNNDDGCIRNADSLFHFADKIEISGCVQNVDLAVLPFYRDQGSLDRETSLLLLLRVIGDGVSILDLTHSGCYACQMAHSLCQSCLTCSAVTEQNDISDFISCVNFHC